MKTKHNLIYLIFIATILAILLSSCEYSKIKFGEVRMMYGSNENGHISYDISTFTGFESVSAQVATGEIISFEYEAIVDKGNPIIEWQDPTGVVVWRKNLLESDHGHDDIVVESSGIYTIIIQGKDAGGNFDVSWKIE